VIDMPFNTIVEECLGALFVAADQYFATRRTQIVTFAALLVGNSNSNILMV
jgi:hypothetical protein